MSKKFDHVKFMEGKGLLLCLLGLLADEVNIGCLELEFMHGNKKAFKGTGVKRSQKEKKWQF